MRVQRSTVGVSLIELLIVLVVVSLLGALAAPSMTAYLQRVRVRAALDRLTGDLYHARVLAVRLGTRLRLQFNPPRGCARWYTLRRADTDSVLRRVSVEELAPGVCLSSNVPRALSVDQRGLLVGSARTVHARAGKQADSLVVSMAGRVLRSP